MSKLLPGILCVFSCIILINGDNEADFSLEKAEQDLSNYLQKLDSNPSIPLIENYAYLEKTDDLIKKPLEQEEDIVEKGVRFLTSRSLRISFPRDEARGLVAEARRKKRIRRILLPLLLILKLKAAIILPIVLSIIALVTFKGFGLGLAALAVAGTTALKNILEHAASSKVSYEVVPTPIGHWSRSGVPEASVPAGVQYDY